MKQIDFLLHTALWEGFGFVVAEAMAAGKPVVSTDVSNISEIIVEGETGYLAETKNPEDIAEKTIKLLENDSREQMGQVGRQVVKDKFSFEEQVDKLANYYLV
jgi:glycosyltransferase involved in cell wall biosynthesis